MNRKRGMTFGNIVKLIIAVAVVIVLLTLVVKLFIPFFDRSDETAKSYFETLKKEIKNADSGEGGEFFMWYLGDSGEDRKFYLVYFGETIEVDFVKEKYIDYGPEVGGELIDIDVQFNSFGRENNRICVCTVYGYDSDRRYCEDLDYPVSYAGKEGGEICFYGD